MGAPSPSPDDSGLIVGTTIANRYRVESVIGTGGMGRVYRAEYTSLGRAVAIKVLHADLGRNKEAAARFQREAMASGRLDHPNIVGTSDFGTLDDGSPYLVMEALEGESVGARLARDGRIPWREAVDITRGVLAGLRHAHDRGVVHRDIKPDNIFLAVKDGDRIIKILDFGIAKLYAGSAGDPAQTRTGLTVGTPAYLSPEQAVGGTITPASDLYSTSVVLYEMLAGRPPYDDKDPLQMLTAHVSREPPLFAQSAPDAEIPQALEDVVRRGMAKIAAERIASAAEYIQLLDGVLGVRSFGEVSSSLAIPMGPHAGIATPVPGSATPFSFDALVPIASPTPTPVPVSSRTPVPSMRTPVPSALTPSPERPSGRISITDTGEPIPRKWLVIAGVVVAIAVVVALVLVIATRGGGKHDRRADNEAEPIETEAKSTSAGMTPLVFDHDTELKAALHDLELGKTCDERKSAIPKLVDLGDARALPPLKKARYRMRGGVLGIGADNTNACLIDDAKAAIKKLDPNADEEETRARGRGRR
jgi:serine/threonine protein kinase